MYTLKEILNMPHEENRRFKIIDKVEDNAYNRPLYVDENGILRYESDKIDIEMHGDNAIVVHSEILDYKYEIIKQYISFHEAFNKWINENNTICCESVDGDIKYYYGNESNKMNVYLFYPIDIAEGKWYVDNEDFNKEDNKIVK